MNYFELWMGDYLKKTLHLDTVEHGAYFMLMVAYYSDERSLPADKQSLYRICKARTKSHKQAVDKVVSEFFFLEDGRYKNDKCEHEIEKYIERQIQNSERGKKSAKTRKLLKKAEEIKSNDSSRTHETQLPIPNPKPQPYINNNIREQPIDFEISQLLYDKIRERDKKARPPNFEKWAKTIRLMRENDGREPEEIRDVLLWCQQPGNFWQPNIQSTDNLRKHFSRLLQQKTNESVTHNRASINSRINFNPTEADRSLIEVGKRIIAESTAGGYGT